jgi:hypothetical protein
MNAFATASSGSVRSRPSICDRPSGFISRTPPEAQGHRYSHRSKIPQPEPGNGPAAKARVCRARIPRSPEKHRRPNGVRAGCVHAHATDIAQASDPRMSRDALTCVLRKSLLILVEDQLWWVYPREGQLQIGCLCPDLPNSNGLRLGFTL